MTRGNRRTHLRDISSIYITQTMCGLRLRPMELWRMRSDPHLVTCKTCRTKLDQQKAKAE